MAETNYPEDITLEAALALIRPLMQSISASRLQSETVLIEDAIGRVLSEDVISPIDVPGRDTAAVDGYAFFYQDIKKTLPVTGQIKAGHPYDGEATPGKAYRIFTGAIMPDGPNTVAMQEYCTVDDDGHVILPQNLKQGTNYRPKGENISKGEIAIKKGVILGAAEIGLAAAMGFTSITVHSTLRISLFSMGDEVVDINTPDHMREGSIFDSNRPMLASMLRNMGHHVIDHGIIEDDHASLTNAFKKASQTSDVILCSGGSSEGDEDHTKSALISCGGVIDFWRLALKPGRPMVSGRIGNVPVFGLPGNPVAAFVCTRLFAEPMMAIMQGGQGSLPPKPRIPSGFAKKHRKGRAEYLRARLEYDNQGDVHIVLNGRPGAGVLSSLTGADGLVEIPIDHDDVKIGDPLPFLMFKEAGL